MGNVEIIKYSGKPRRLRVQLAGDDKGEYWLDIPWDKVGLYLVAEGDCFGLPPLEQAIINFYPPKTGGVV